MGTRQGADVSKAEVGRQMAVSSVTVGMWERGETEPNLATVERLAAYLGVAPGWLAFGQEPKGLRATEENPHHVPPTPMQVVVERGRRKRRRGG